MPKCPRCGKEIDHLLVHSRAIMEYDYSIKQGFKYLDTLEEDFESFYCPKCNEELFDNEDEAFEFLKQHS
jgi:predicted RNA-binding Zn-ribbon protein involved in translation (DUF1610 family)